MSETFSCPNCGASLEFKGGNEFTFPCPFCGTSVIVPQNLRSPLSPGKANEIAVFQMIQDLLKAGKKNDAVFLYGACYPKNWSMGKKVVDGIEAGTVRELPEVEVEQRTLDTFAAKITPKKA